MAIRKLKIQRLKDFYRLRVEVESISQTHIIWYHWKGFEKTKTVLFELLLYYIYWQIYCFKALKTFLKVGQWPLLET